MKLLATSNHGAHREAMNEGPITLTFCAPADCSRCRREGVLNCAGHAPIWLLIAKDRAYEASDCCQRMHLYIHTGKALGCYFCRSAATLPTLAALVRRDERTGAPL
jgi:hypothetical protein